MSEPLPSNVQGFNVQGLTGWDWVLSMILPEGLFVAHVAKKLRSSIWKGWDTKKTALIIRYNGGAWRVVDDGVEPVSGELTKHLSGGL